MYRFESIKRTGCTLRGHLHFIDGSVGIEFDRFDAGFSHRPASMGRAMIKHIPLVAELDDGTVVVPCFRITTGIVHDDAFVLVWSQRRFSHGISDACRTLVLTDVGIDEVVILPSLDDIASFVEIVVCFGDDAVYVSGPIECFQIRIHLGSLGRELAPEIISLSVIVDEDVGVNLLGTFYLYTILERTCR